MLAAIITTVLYSAASALVPALPAEPYLLGLVAATNQSPVALGIAAGVGQSAGKVMIFLAIRGTIRSPWLRRRLSRLVAFRTDASTSGPTTTDPSPNDPSADPSATDTTASTGTATGTVATATAASPETGPEVLTTTKTTIAAETATVTAATATTTVAATATAASSPETEATATAASAETATIAEATTTTNPTTVATLMGNAAAKLGSWMPAPLRRFGSTIGRLTRAMSRWLTRALDRPVVAALTVFVSAVIGLPPLLATTVYASVTRMSVILFGSVCVVGRSIRFIAIALVPTLIM